MNRGSFYEWTASASEPRKFLRVNHRNFRETSEETSAETSAEASASWSGFLDIADIRPVTNGDHGQINAFVGQIVNGNNCLCRQWCYLSFSLAKLANNNYRVHLDIVVCNVYQGAPYFRQKLYDQLQISGGVRQSMAPRASLSTWLRTRKPKLL